MQSRTYTKKGSSPEVLYKQINKIMDIKSFFLTAIVATIVASLPVVADPVRHFGRGARFDVNDLPDSKLRDKLSSLPQRSRQRALKNLHKLSFTDLDVKSLNVDDQGVAFYVDAFPAAKLKSSPQMASAIEQPQSTASAAAVTITAEEAFHLHSRPGSSNIIYLDFNGRDISGTEWNIMFSGGETLKAKAFSTDSDANFSASELSLIAHIWHQVAEDFATFDVDVTTEEPAAFGAKTGTILFTNSTDADGRAMPNAGSAAGVGFANVWGADDYPRYSPALVYCNIAGFAPANIGQVASHEMGHNLGLSHDGYNGYEYDTGHGVGVTSWGPIMGATYNVNVSKWSNGDYPLATQQEDDMAIIAEKLGYRPDDHGSTDANPTPLAVNLSGEIKSTTPETDPDNANTSNKGIIETRDDVDFFMFDSESGTINLAATPAWEAFYSKYGIRGANLDIKLALYDLNGNKLTESDPQDETEATIATTVEKGRYLLSIEGVGNTVTPYSDYGSVGQYFITGNVVVPPPVAQNGSVTLNEDTSTTITLNASDPNGSPLTYSVTPVAHGSLVNNNNGTVTYTPSPDYFGQDGFSFTAKNVANNTASAIVGITVSNVSDAPIAKAAVTRKKGSSKYKLDFSSAGTVDPDNDALTYLWDFGDGLSSTGANPSHYYCSPGVYTVNLYVTDPSGLMSQRTINHLIKGKPTTKKSATCKKYQAGNDYWFGLNTPDANDAPVARASGGKTAKKSKYFITFSSLGSGDADDDALTYLWDFGDGFTSTEKNHEHAYCAPGIYTVKLVVTDPSGPSSQTVFTQKISGKPGVSTKKSLADCQAHTGDGNA